MGQWRVQSIHCPESGGGGGVEGVGTVMKNTHSLTSRLYKTDLVSTDDSSLKIYSTHMNFRQETKYILNLEGN